METKNLAFYGTLATDGSAKGVVIATGHFLFTFLIDYNFSF
jgi:magnesium-transporting ATPase (P-type)